MSRPAMARNPMAGQSPLAGLPAVLATSRVRSQQALTAVEIPSVEARDTSRLASQNYVPTGASRQSGAYFAVDGA